MSPTKPRQRPHSSSSATPTKSNRHTHKMSSSSRQQQPSAQSSSSNPIQTFINTISRLPPDEWRAKTDALEALVSAISSHTPPEHDCDDNASIHSSHSHDDRSISSSVSGSSSLSYRSNRSNRSNRSLPLAWNSHRSLLRSRPPSSPSPRNNGVTSPSNAAPSFLSPQTLRTLAIPFRSLLSDLRTMVVKSACHNLSLIAGLTGDKSRGLIKDLLPDMLALHSQTVKVMHGYAMAAMLGIIQATKFKTGVGILMREMRLNKSKDVRMACVRYLRHMIDSWPISYLQTQSESIGDSFAKALVDPCQAVRMEARNAFLRSFYTHYPQAWYKIVHTPDGVISKDPRMKRTILMQSSTIERISSPSSTVEEDKKDDKDDRNAVNPFQGVEMGANTPITKNRRPVDKKPLSIKRRTIAFEDSVKNNDHTSSVTSELQQKAASSIQAAVRGVLLRRSLPSLPPTAHHMTERRKTLKGVVPPLPATPSAIRLGQDDTTSPLSEGGGDQPSWFTTPQPVNRRRTSSIPRSSDKKGRSPTNGMWPEYQQRSLSTLQSPATPTLLTPSPRVLRRDSVLLQKRLPDAHVSIGRDLLREHKKNMDKLMSGLKEEMDLISNIERKLRYDITEDDVLEYFENIYNFMDKRAEVAVELKGTLERVSRGD